MKARYKQVSKSRATAIQSDEGLLTSKCACVMVEEIDDEGDGPCQSMSLSTPSALSKR
jgi:hypothetical protein